MGCVRLYQEGRKFHQSEQRRRDRAIKGNNEKNGQVWASEGEIRES
jgi:hypothetical protein